ncbi:MAG TPA: DUF1275 family protein [Tepidisphaeraceae bacterium]|jgi:uncharacterized membrane protein YoaK (UPF0700 family)/anti-anti-sigma regulatory factor|nr:DUF1275 family protein [Tepidisphaeraceae bacterium]
MFVSHAHSFRQQARLAVTLAWVAGYTDVLALLTCGGYVSHMSGNTATFGHTLAAGEWRIAAFDGFLLLTFFCGAAISGFCTELGRRRRWESIFVLPIALEIVAFALFATLVVVLGEPAQTHQWQFPLAGLVAAAMGLQNATITYISSGVVRTTHVTGVITDLGHEGAQFLCWLRDRRQNTPPTSPEGILRSVFHHPPARRLALLAAILGMFVLGAGLGTLAHGYLPRSAMFIPVVFLAWLVYQDVTKPIAEIEPSTLVNKESGIDLPGAIAIYHLRRDHDRRGRVHRMPNLLAWAEQLPAATQVVILDLGGVIQINSNSAMELKAMIGQFRQQRRSLILAGINEQQFQQISRSAGDGLLEPGDVCGDLELAIARGIILAEHAQRAML